MAANKTETTMDELQGKLDHFLAELLILGTVKGFKHFVTYIRGKEELLISVVNSPMMTNKSSFTELEVIKQNYKERMMLSPSNSGSFTSKNLPYDKRTLMLSLRTQRQLSGLEENDQIALPPASPSEHELRTPEENSTLFLLAAYSRYSAPYVWLRSNHSRLVQQYGDQLKDKDWPLNLKSTLNWRTIDIPAWVIMAEIVKLCTVPSPLNPFEIDLEYFTNLDPGAAFYATAAMVDLLSRVISQNAESLIYAGKVLEDIQALTKLHYDCITNLCSNGTLQ